jgi:integrase
LFIKTSVDFVGCRNWEKSCWLDAREGWKDAESADFFTGNQIVVRAGKGDKDRHTMLPGAIKEPLAKHLEFMKEQHRHDLEHGTGRVALPNALDRKYPNAGKEWAWQWVFPATRYYVDRITGRQYRHHLHESVLQKAVREAARNAGIAKPATCHSLRPIFWKMDTISGPYKSCWGTVMSARR